MSSGLYTTFGEISGQSEGDWREELKRVKYAKIAKREGIDHEG